MKDSWHPTATQFGPGWMAREPDRSYMISWPAVDSLPVVTYWSRSYFDSDGHRRDEGAETPAGDWRVEAARNTVEVSTPTDGRLLAEGFEAGTRTWPAPGPRTTPTANTGG
jgi:hypothetical protein